MGEFNIWEWSVHLHDHLQLNKCLCNFPLRSAVQKVYRDVLHSSSASSSLDDYVQRKKNRLLLVSILQLVGEIYANEALMKHSVCREICAVLNVYLSDEFWDDFMNCLRFMKEKHLVWAYIKSFSSILYSSPESLFRSRMEILLTFLEENLFDESCLSVLEFLTHLVDHKMISCTDGDTSICRNSSKCKITSPEELLLCFSSMLSQKWEKFVEHFHCITKVQCENNNVHQYILLWKSLIDKQFGIKLDSVFLKEQYILHFFCAHNLPLLSCRLYLDIIIQIFYSNLKCKMSQKIESTVLENNVAHAIENNILDLYPHTCEVLEFCSSSCRKRSEVSPRKLQKCDSVIMQKAAFIFLNILAEVENECLIYEALKSVLNFLKKNSDIPSDEPTHAWLLDIFVNQDDVLIGIMLALLRIYIRLKGKHDLKNNECAAFSFSEFQLNLNPHKIFINFLQRLGFNHNELLSFLTSDETCFLLYLTEYLKLLMTEPKNFVKAHQSSSKSNVKLTEVGADISEMNTNISIDELCSSSKDSLPSHVLFNNDEFVSSLCISSSDEETATIENCIDIKCDKRNTLNSLLVLMKLKVAVIKLVNLGEFPYKVSHLISLLEMCEKHFAESF